MKDDNSINGKSSNKLSRRKYILAAVIILLLIIVSLIYIWFNQEPKLDPASEAIIKKFASDQLYIETEIKKDPIELSDSDFVKITGFAISSFNMTQIELADIKLLEKFTNLKMLGFENISYPSNAIPKWMKVMSKLGIFSLKETFALDISPLEKLKSLETLFIVNTPIKDIKPLAGLTNLRAIYLVDTKDINFEPLKNLRNLKLLYLEGTSASNLESIRGLTNLQELRIVNCNKITDEQIEELQKALPKLRIER